MDSIESSGPPSQEIRLLANGESLALLNPDKWLISLVWLLISIATLPS